MTITERINDHCGLALCESVRRRKSDNATVVMGAGGGRSMAQYNRLVKAVRHVLGSAVVRWNGEERVV